MTTTQIFRKFLLLKPEYPAYFISGSRGGGKTVTTEWIANWYYEHGYLVMSMWGSFDMENAFYCIGDPKRTGKNVGLPVLIIHPRTTIVKANNPLCICGEPTETPHACDKPMPVIRTIPDDTDLRDILVTAHRERRVIIFNRGFYNDQKDAYRRLARYLNEYPYLIVKKAIPTDVSICMIFNELGNIAPSGLKGMVGSYETNTKREIQTLIREARHVRTVLVADFQRSNDIAKSIASQRDCIIFKRSTRDLIADDYQWFYDAVERMRERKLAVFDFDGTDNLPSLSRLKPWQAYILYPDRHFELRTTGMPPFKHKKPNENWADLANVTIEYISGGDKAKQSAEVKIQAIMEQKEKNTNRLKALQMAEDLLASGVSLYEACRQVGWYGKDGKPSPDSLRMARKRAIESGRLEPKVEQ